MKGPTARAPDPSETPRALGYAMPPEWARHAATWIAWPHNREDWPGRFAPIPWIYAEIVRQVSRGEQLRIPRIYSALSELKGRDVILSGLYFSITGAVCYSRQIEETLRSLVAKGILVPKERDTVIVRDEAAEEIRARLRRKLPESIYRSLLLASKRFHARMFRGR